MSLNKLKRIAKLHNVWVESKGWHNKPNHTLLTLIGSEVGEAVNEVLF